MGSIIPGTALSLFCRSRIQIGDDPSHFLDGRTGNGTVGLALGDLEPFTGARWLARPVPSGPPNHVFLQCLGDVDGNRFLDGNTIAGTVSLAPHTNEPFTGTRWEILDAGADDVFLQCLGASTGGQDVRILHGHVGKGTVDLIPEPGARDHADRWGVLDAQPVPNGGPGVTSATSNNSPSLVLDALGVPRPPGQSRIVMAWRALDGRISIMYDVLGQPFTVSLAHTCIDRPALALGVTAGQIRQFFLAWTGADQSINVMSSDNGLVFAGRVTLPRTARSAFGPAITVFSGKPVVAWADADTGDLRMWNGTHDPIVSIGETSSAAPALLFLPDFSDEPRLVAWTGTNAERQLNVMFSEFSSFPPTQHKTTLPSDGPSAATSNSGPSLASKVGPDNIGFLAMGWTGLPGGPDHDNHLNEIFSGNFELFDQRRTVAPVSDVGPAIVDDTRVADGNLFVAWVDRRSQINTAHYNDLPVIAA